MSQESAYADFGVTLAEVDEAIEKVVTGWTNPPTMPGLASDPAKQAAVRRHWHDLVDRIHNAAYDNDFAEVKQIIRAPHVGFLDDIDDKVTPPHADPLIAALLRLRRQSFSLRNPCCPVPAAEQRQARG